jgi:small-conductance mechanosensitive channel
MRFLDQTFLGNTMRQWAIALAVAAAVLAGLRIALAIIVSRLGALSRKTQTEWDDVIFHAVRKTKFLILLAAAVYAGSLYLKFSPGAHAGLRKAIVVIAWFQVGIWLSAGFRSWFDSHREKRLAQDASAAPVMNAVGYAVAVALWSIILLVVLDNLGFKVTTLLTGLGVGGIAVALALQNVLGDVFASLSIILDKPFVIGDFLTVGEYMGTVQRIGLKTTRMKSLTGEELVFSNNDLLASRIRNYGRMTERRIVFAVGVTYQTPRAKLEKIPAILRAAVEAQDKCRFDRAHFKSYGDFAIIYEVVYYVVVPDYNQYMDVQQAINLSAHEQFEKEGIEFAYPTQTIFLAKETS